MTEDFNTWIPDEAKFIYQHVWRRGGYSDARKNKVLDALFSDKKLEHVWPKLARKHCIEGELSFLIGSIITSTDCAPPDGVKRVTRDRPDFKIKVLEKQKKADKIIQKAAKKAQELADLLADLEENGGEIPREVASGLRLIGSSIESDSMASACCFEPFKEFKSGLSSGAKSYFPRTLHLIECLALSLDNHSPDRVRFSDSPWLSSNQSSWVDYLRVLQDVFDDAKHMYGYAPELTPVEWLPLLQTVLDIELTLQDVQQALMNK